MFKNASVKHKRGLDYLYEAGELFLFHKLYHYWTKCFKCKCVYI